MRAPDRQEPDRDQYSRFVRSQPPIARRQLLPPRSLEGWEKRLAAVREGLRRSFGRFPSAPSPLEPEILGTLARPGYVIERLTFQSRPEVRVTANIYRPASSAKGLPGVLSVHGHWPWARIDPVVQTRCIGLAKLGYVC